MHYDDQFRSIDWDDEESQPDGERVEPMTSSNFEINSKKTLRGVFIYGKPKLSLILNAVGLAFTAFCAVAIAAHLTSAIGIIVSAFALTWFILRFVGELRKYLRPTKGILWSTAKFEDDVCVSNGEALRVNYTIQDETVYDVVLVPWWKRWLKKPMAWLDFETSLSNPIVCSGPPPEMAVLVEKPLYSRCPFSPKERYDFTPAFGPFQNEVLDFREFLVCQCVRDSEFYRFAYRTDARHLEAIEKVFGHLPSSKPTRLFGIPIVDGLDRWEPRAEPWVEREEETSE